MISGGNSETEGYHSLDPSVISHIFSKQQQSILFNTQTIFWDCDWWHPYYPSFLVYPECEYCAESQNNCDSNVCFLPSYTFGLFVL